MLPVTESSSVRHVVISQLHRQLLNVDFVDFVMHLSRAVKSPICACPALLLHNIELYLCITLHLHQQPVLDREGLLNREHRLIRAVCVCICVCVVRLPPPNACHR